MADFVTVPSGAAVSRCFYMGARTGSCLLFVLIKTKCLHLTLLEISFSMCILNGIATVFFSRPDSVALCNHSASVLWLQVKSHDIIIDLIVIFCELKTSSWTRAKY